MFADFAWSVFCHHFVETRFLKFFTRFNKINVNKLNYAVFLSLLYFFCR
jgi:hypothetical protein